MQTHGLGSHKHGVRAGAHTGLVRGVTHPARPGVCLTAPSQLSKTYVPSIGTKRAWK